MRVFIGVVIITGTFVSGSGVNLSGNVTNGSVLGSATVGTGVKVSGDIIVINSTLHGTTNNGIGLDVSHGNVGGKGATVTGSVTGGGAGVGSVGDKNITVTPAKPTPPVIPPKPPVIPPKPPVIPERPSSSSGVEDRVRAELQQLQALTEHLGRGVTPSQAGFMPQATPVDVIVCTDGECRTLQLDEHHSSPGTSTSKEAVSQTQH